MRKPIIGIPSQRKKPIPDGGCFAGAFESYIEAVVYHGGAPLLLPLLTEEQGLRAVYDLCDGILLPGGEDIAPSNYGEAPHEKLGYVDPKRDASDIQIIRWAFEEKKPFLGICRGHQAIAVALGGSLYQDLPSQLGVTHVPPVEGPQGWALLVHDVHIAEGSVLHKLLKTERIRTNSHHHQAIKELPPSFQVSGIAPDKVIEGIEAPYSLHPFAVGVQGHPELLYLSVEPQWSGIFQGLIEASRNK